MTESGAQPQKTPDDEQGYNGWPNYVTWCVHAHLTNTPEIMERARSSIAEYNVFVMPRAECALKGWVVDDLLAYDIGGSDGSAQGLLVADLVTHALAGVAWESIVLALWSES